MHVQLLFLLKDVSVGKIITNNHGTVFNIFRLCIQRRITIRSVFLIYRAALKRTLRLHTAKVTLG